MDDQHEPLSVLAFALDDGVVLIGAVKSSVTLEIVADKAASRPRRGAHEAAQLMGVGCCQDGEPPARMHAAGTSQGKTNGQTTTNTPRAIDAIPGITIIRRERGFPSCPRRYRPSGTSA